jgi:hypothetical protein
MDPIPRPPRPRLVRPVGPFGVGVVGSLLVVAAGLSGSGLQIDQFWFGLTLVGAVAALIGQERRDMVGAMLGGWIGLFAYLIGYAYVNAGVGEASLGFGVGAVLFAIAVPVSVAPGYALVSVIRTQARRRAPSVPRP